MNEKNLSMLCDFYEFTMSNAYFLNGFYKKKVYFDVFFRNIPDGGGFAISAGLSEIIDYIENLHFNDENIEFLRSKQMFSEDFLKYLKKFKFSGDIYSVPEGTVVFPNEPIMIVHANTIEAQIIETFVLLNINHQSLIATKANRIKRAAGEKIIMEFGSRRAQGLSAAVLGARAAFIGGCELTSCTLTDEIFSVPSGGTMAHSWVQMFSSEYQAFKAYCEIYPTKATLLVDTYDTLKSGIPNAIKAFKEVLLPKGITDFSIRLDSGDIAYLSKKAREMMDNAGLYDCKIVASNSLDEYLIRDLILQEAKVDIFGVGECLITSKSSPIFGGVYKLCAIEENNEIIPKIKISENISKITNPHFKKVYRLFDKESGKAIADQICIYNEKIDESTPLTIFDPKAVWKIKTLNNFSVRELLKPIFIDGVRVYDSPNIKEIRNYCQGETNTLWEEIKRFEHPHEYYVDLSKKLWYLKDQMLKKYRNLND